MEELLNLVKQLAAVEERLRNLNEERENADDDSRFYIDQQIAAQRSERMALEERYYALMDSFEYDEIRKKMAPAGRGYDLARISDTEANLRWRIINDARIRNQKELARRAETQELINIYRKIKNAKERVIILNQERAGADSDLRLAIDQQIAEQQSYIMKLEEQYYASIDRVGYDAVLSDYRKKYENADIGDDVIGDMHQITMDARKRTQELNPKFKTVKKQGEEIAKFDTTDIRFKSIEEKIKEIAEKHGMKPEDLMWSFDGSHGDLSDDGDTTIYHVYKTKMVQEPVDDLDIPEKPAARKNILEEKKKQEQQTRGGAMLPDAGKKFSIVYDAKKGTYEVTREDGTTEEYEAKALNMKKQAKIDYIASQIPKEFLDIILTIPIPNMPNKTLKSLDPDLVVILYKEFGGQREGAYAARDYVLSLAGKTRGYDRSSLKYSMTYDLSELGEAKYSNGEPMSAIDRARIINLADANKNVADVKISEKTRIPLFTRIKLGIKNAVSRILKGEKKALPAATESKAKAEEQKAKAEEQKAKAEEPKAKAEEQIKYGAKLDVNVPGSLTQTVEYLRKCKSEGKNVYVIFNGHKLYSQDVTLDDAYIEVTGTPKSVHDEFSRRLKLAEAGRSEEEIKKVRAEWDKARRDYRAKRERKEAATKNGFDARVRLNPDDYVQSTETSEETLTTEIPEETPIIEMSDNDKGDK